MVWWRRAPTCRGTTADGSPCVQRVARLGDRCTACMEALAASPDRHTRRKLAGQTDLAPNLIDALATDEDRRIRLVIARRSDCPLVTLQRLERDEDAAIRAAAGSGLSAALAPRALASSEAGGLFTEAELEALGAPAPGPVSSPDDGDGLGIGPRPAGPGMGEVLARLDAIGERLGRLEGQLARQSGRFPAASRPSRKVAIGEDDAAQPHLPGLGDDAPAHRPEPRAGRRQRLHSRRP